MPRGEGEGLPRGVWHVAREFAGLAEAGGLKDAVAGLAAAQVRAGIRTAVVLPRYGFLAGLQAERLPVKFTLALPSGNEASAPSPEPVEVYRIRREGVELFLLDSARTRGKRDVYTYTSADELENPERKKGTGHWDAHHVNLILQRGALELARRARRLGWPGPPVILHCHDGHAGFLPAILRLQARGPLRRTRALLTLHNAGSGYHQEIYGLQFARQLTGLPLGVLEQGLSPEAPEAVDPLLVGPLFAPVNTVSEQYAEEIASGALDRLTGGLGKAYREAGIRLRGITNGIDPGPYDPRFPAQTGLAYAFDPARGDLEGKRQCRRWLAAETAGAAPAGRSAPAYLRQARRGLSREFAPGSPLAGLSCFGSLKDDSGSPLFTFVGRLASQKGVDVLAGAAARLLGRKADLRFLVLGQGERALEERLAELAGDPAAAGRFCLLVGFNSLAARYCYAAGDFFLVPSLYEPCGLTDLYAQMMGSLPVVHRVGGLVKVRHGETGYSYAEHSPEALCRAIEEAADDHRRRPDHLEGMRRLAFREVLERFTWDRVLADGYLPLYRELQAPA
jgi:starch synthase